MWKLPLLSTKAQLEEKSCTSCQINFFSHSISRYCGELEIDFSWHNAKMGFHAYTTDIFSTKLSVVGQNNELFVVISENWVKTIYRVGFPRFGYFFILSSRENEDKYVQLVCIYGFLYVFLILCFFRVFILYFLTRYTKI